jgi:Helix-turn-helix domain
MPKADPRALELGQRLHQAANHRGMKQADIVRALGALPGTISRYFTGTRRVSDTDRLDEIAALLGVSYEWLSLGRGEPKYDPNWRRPPPESDTLPPSAGGAAPGRRSAVGGTAPAKSTSATEARQTTSGGEHATDDPYLERRRAFVALRTHLQGDCDRVRDSLLLLSGPPYDTWTRDEWEEEALRERDRLSALDARWKKQAPSPAPARLPRASKGGR